MVLLPPEKPVLIYDGNCNFCKFWARRWESGTCGRIRFIASQDPEMVLLFPEIPRQRFNESVQLVETTGWVYQGAEAVFRMANYSWMGNIPLWIYQHASIARTISERLYYFVARHRTSFSKLNRLFFRTNY